jgi:hypothetical protein
VSSSISNLVFVWGGNFQKAWQISNYFKFYFLISLSTQIFALLTGLSEDLFLRSSVGATGAVASAGTSTGRASAGGATSAIFQIKF